MLESETLEFKRQLPQAEKLAMEIMALANTRGGYIIVGYDSKAQTFHGIVPDQKTEEWIANVVADYCKPRVEFDVSYESVESQPLLIINVRASGMTPHYLKNASMTSGTYVRVGSTTRRADQETLARLIRRGHNVSFDSESLGVDLSLSRTRLQEYLKFRQRRLGGKIGKVRRPLLEDLGLFKGSRPTVAGALLFLDEPQSVSTLEHAYVRAARFKGDAKGIILDQREILGPLTEQIEQGVHFVLRNTRLRGSVVGTHRADVYEYPLEIVREMLVNAIVHRDYSIAGQTILLAIYDDRIEISSPGGLAGPVTSANIIDRQYSRNPILSKRMFEMGFFEAWGQGVDQIVAWAKDNQRQPPRFIDEVHQFTLIVYGEDIAERKLEPRAHGVETDLEEKILKHLKSHDVIRNRDTRALFDATKTQAQTALTRLLEGKHIERHGSGRSTYYTRRVS